VAFGPRVIRYKSNKELEGYLESQLVNDALITEADIVEVDASQNRVSNVQVPAEPVHLRQCTL